VKSFYLEFTLQTKLWTEAHNQQIYRSIFCFDEVLI